MRPIPADCHWVKHFDDILISEKKKLGANVMKRVAAGALLPTPWLFKSAKRPDDRADYCLEVDEFKISIF